MEEHARVEWDKRYRERSHSSLTPDPFLIAAFDEFVSPAFPNGGDALDIAGGVGRHALYLAGRRWRVTLVDVSAEGLQAARSEAQKRQLDIAIQQADLTEWLLPRASFDLVLNFFYLERALFSQMFDALRPGGFVVFKTYTCDQLALGGGPSHPMHLLERNELLHAFRDLRILHYHESVRRKAVAELVAQKL